MKKYLERLSQALDNVNANNKSQILEKYKKRYEFGLESGLSEKEIEEMLGNPEDIAEKYRTNVNDFDNKRYDENQNCIIRTVNDDIVIKKSKDDKIHVYFEDCIDNAYDTKKCLKNGIRIEYDKTKYFSLNRKHSGLITVEIPEDRLFYKADISTANGDIKIDSLSSNDMEIVTASGDIVCHKLEAKKIKITLVSGDAFVDKAYSKNIVLSAVSGDIEINHANSDELHVDTISGNCNIKEATGIYKTSSVTGEIIINGEACGNVKSYMKGLFKK